MRFICLFFITFISFHCYAQNYQIDTLRLYYPIDITTLGNAAKKSLDSLGSMVKRNKKAVVSITGFADYLGTNPHNIDLSVSRAAKVREYLINTGLDTLQIKVCEGKGALQPGENIHKQKGIPEHRKTEVIITWPVFKKPPKKTPSISIKNLKKGDTFTLKDLNFEGGRHFLISESYRVLQDLTNIMKTNPTLKIEIQGHICCDSISEDGLDNDTRSNDLSYQRAKVVFDHLWHMGIDSTRMIYKGYGGKHRLIKDERTEIDRMRNRRVEVKILEK